MFEAGLLSEFGFLVSFLHPRRFSQGLGSREQASGYVWPCGYVQVWTGFWVRQAQQCPFDFVFCSGVVWLSCRSDIFQIIWRLVVAHVIGNVVEGFSTSYSWWAFISFSALLRANSCRVSQWMADTVDQILTGDAMYVKAFDDGTIPDKKHCRWRTYPTEFVGLRWLLIQPN